MDASSSGRRPRPLADAPHADGRDIAKGWLLALLADAPLEAAAAVPAGELARDAPSLAAAVVRALGSDAELVRLEPGGDLAGLAARAGALGGATSPGGIVRAIDVLRRAAWGALTAGLATPDPSLVAGLADRLAHICAVIAEASLGAAHPAAQHLPTLPGHGRPAPAPVRPAAAQHPGAAAAPPPTPPAGWPDAAPAPPAAWDGAAPADRMTDPAPLDLPAAGPADNDHGVDGAAAAGDPRGSGHAHPFSGPALDGPFAAHDVRPHDTPGWRAAIDRRLERHASDRRSFAVLLVEVDDLDRLVEAAPGEMAIALEKVERAVCEELRPADMLERERPGRYWLTTPDTGPAGARELGERVAIAIAGAAQHRGVPLTASIGVAVCPEDGQEADALAAHADEGVWAARAAGVRLA